MCLVINKLKSYILSPFVNLSCVTVLKWLKVDARYGITKLYVKETVRWYIT